MSDIVVTKKNEGKILCVELNIPQKGNALSLNIIRKLTEFFQAVPKGRLKRLSFPAGESISYRIALGKYQGRKALTFRTAPQKQHQKQKPFLAQFSSFSLHAGISSPAHDRKKRERFCRYISRPSLSEQRLFVNVQGQVVYKLKTAYQNGTTHIILSPLDFLSRLASLIPRPRVHLIRFHGVFAPHFKYRSLIVPQPSFSDKTSHTEQKKSKQSYSIGWAKMLKRVFDIDIQICPKCGGQIKITSAIHNPQIIKRILTHLGENSTVPELSPSRGPPETEESLVSI